MTPEQLRDRLRFLQGLVNRELQSIRDEVDERERYTGEGYRELASREAVNAVDELCETFARHRDWLDGRPAGRGSIVAKVRKALGFTNP